MSKSMRGSAGSLTRVTTLVGLLDWMARREAIGEIAVNGDGTRSLKLTSRRAETQTGVHATWVVFQDARAGGLIAATDETGVHWTLSRTGRVALRRLRSQGDGPPAKTGAQGDRSSRLPELTSQAHVNATESPLSWLRRRKDRAGEPLITAVQFDAGERLRADFLYAEMTPRVTVNWAATGGSSARSGGGLGVDLRDNVVAAQQRVRRALLAVGPISAGLLIDVCGHLLGLEEVERTRGWPRRSGKLILEMALTELARHYGLPGAVEVNDRVESRLRHWGMEGYRPQSTASPD